MLSTRRQFSASVLGLAGAGMLARFPLGLQAADNGDKPGVTAWPLPRGDERSTGVVHGELPADMKLAWKFSVKDGAFLAPAVIAAGLVFVGDADGTFYAFNLADGEVKWKHKLDTSYSGGAAYRDGKVFVGDLDGRVRCHDAKSGDIVWEYSTGTEEEPGGEISSSPNFYKNILLVGSRDATLYAVNIADGKSAWKYTIADQIRCAPTVVGNRTFLAGCDAKLHIVDLDKGEAVTTVDIKSQTGSSPAAMGDRVYFGSADGRLYGVDRKTGKEVWKYEAGGRFRAGPAAADGKLVIGNENGTLYCFGAK
jgi:outer membrane protein assembly factor BamB